MRGSISIWAARMQAQNNGQCCPDSDGEEEEEAAAMVCEEADNDEDNDNNASKANGAAAVASSGGAFLMHPGILYIHQAHHDTKLSSNGSLTVYLNVSVTVDRPLFLSQTSSSGVYKILLPSGVGVAVP